MIHQYVAALDGTCRVCKRPALDHSLMAICEACSNFANTDNDIRISNDILLCASCYEKENQVPVEPAPVIDTSVINGISLGSIPIVTNCLADLPSDGNEFFNARTIAIKELELRINADDSIAPDQKRFFLTQQMLIRQTILKDNLFKVKELELEIQSERAANQIAINRLAPLIRKEERAKLQLEHIEYKPSEPKSPKAIKMSKADMAIDGYAKLMGITFEHAKAFMAQSIKEAHDMLGNKCSCSETPGFCKIHFPTKQ